MKRVFGNGGQQVLGVELWKPVKGALQARLAAMLLVEVTELKMQS
jgi:hypothetical protein